ncbi:hypothetical protein ABW20_dc0110524 [Dactylellina cionopaga]|nr:hypothetical protein ABW20_dc0110524 [Dactylellina cionopaga]
MENEELRIEQRQISEDCRVFGERYAPLELLENDDMFISENLSTQTFPRSEDVGLEANISALDEMDSVIQDDTLTSGRITEVFEPSDVEDDFLGPRPTPLDRWLDQVSSTLDELDIGDGSAGELHTTANENDESNDLERFRHVHIDQAIDEGSIASREPKNVHSLANIEFSARIFYRNIQDKFPQMPEYLAMRLALANERRAERLHPRIVQGSEASIDFSVNHFQVPTVNEARGLKDKVRSLSPKDDSYELPTNSTPKFIPVTYPPVPRIQQWTGPENFGSLLSNPRFLEKSYWSGNYRFPGPRSSASGSSKRHSSLHGFNIYEREQLLEELYQLEKSSSASIGNKYSFHSDNTHDLHEPLLSLPPPPIELGTQKSFTCDICDNKVEVLRRRDWK